MGSEIWRTRWRGGQDKEGSQLQGFNNMGGRRGRGDGMELWIKLKVQEEEDLDWTVDILSLLMLNSVGAKVMVHPDVFVKT